MSKIFKTNLPKNSLIANINYHDYSDCLGVKLDRSDININDVVNCFFTTSPEFVAMLMKLRDFIMQFAGLKTGNYSKVKKVVFEPGKEVGLFKMIQKNDNEAIIGTDDKHLNFRVSLYVTQKDNKNVILISTVVKFNNNWGKIYMTVVKPFHKVIVASIIENMHKSLIAIPVRGTSLEK